VLPFLPVKRLWPIAAKAAPGFSGLLAVVLLGFLFLAANGTAHQALHHGDDSGSAHCAVCLLLHGQVVAADTAVATAVAAPLIAGPWGLPGDVLRVVSRWLPPDRGPPVSALPV
jgi:hypothetical protein